MPTPSLQGVVAEASWGDCSLQGLNNIEVAVPDKEAFPGGGSSRPISIPPYFWGEVDRLDFPVYKGYSEARALVGKGATEDLRRLCREAEDMLAKMFASIGGGTSGKDKKREASQPRVVQLRLSAELALWKATQHALGNVLPPKGSALRQVSPRVLALLGANDWPKALTTCNTLFGCGMLNLLVGAADLRTLFSNYVTDMAFYYEHGFNLVFPSLQGLVHDGIADPIARATPAGTERREAATIGMSYIQAKVALEATHKTRLENLAGQMDRRTAQVISLSESGLLGIAAEAIARGFDAGAVMSDMVFSSPTTDVVDVGSDLVNSEIMNSFLNVADITTSGVVSEETLRTIYDAYAAACARMYTKRWQEPSVKMCAMLYTWHIHNDRHMFLRRALLGWPKARKSPARPQLEADFDELFDADFRTTGFSRPLEAEYACDGEETCNHVRHFLDRPRERQDQDLVAAFWRCLVTAPLEYVRQGKVDEQREEELTESSRLHMAQLVSRGLVVEVAWLQAHAHHHAWQVNYLFEAAMFGSILDGGELIGKLDRAEAEAQAQEETSPSEVLGSP